MLYSPEEDRGEILVSCLLIIFPFSLCLIVSLALLGPSIGNIFSNIVYQL